MSELRLNCLVDIVLVVGSDSYSKLERRKKSTSRSSDLPKPSPPREKNGLLDEATSVSYADLVSTLTDPNLDYHAQVLQIFSSSLANYPHRPEEAQISNYPYHLGSEEAVRQLMEEDYSPLRISQTEAMRRQSSLTGPGSFYDSKGRRHTLSTLTLNQCVKSNRKGSHPTSLSNGHSQISRTVSTTGSSSSRAATALLTTKSADMPLSMDQINAICQLSFPDGFRCLDASNGTRVPKPNLTNYVLTDLNGDRFYAVTLTFHRKVFIEEDDENKKDVPCYLVSYNQADCQTNSPSLLSDEEAPAEVYIPECIVLVSSYPYFKTLQTALTQIYSALQSNMADFDNLISRYAVTLTNLPVPPPGGELSLTFKLDIDSMRITMHPSSHPSQRVVDVDVFLLFKMLRVIDICRLIAAVLQEQRIVFVSSSYSLLTVAQESLMHIIYPFRWQSMYVPILTSAMIGLVEAPGYFIMGCHRDYLSVIKAVDGLIIVDLDKKEVTSGSFEWVQQLPIAKASSNFCAKVINLQMSFDLASSGHVIHDFNVAKEEFDKNLNKEIVDLSLTLMVDLFHDVMDHIIPEQHFFNKTRFLEAQKSENTQFYENCLKTTMFSAFLRERMSMNQPIDLWQVAVSNRNSNGMRKSVVFKHQFTQKSSNVPHNLPYLKTLSQFQEDVLLNLSSLFGIPSKNKLHKPVLLYLMGSVNIQRGHLADGLNNFGEMNSLDSSLLPKDAIAERLRSLPYQTDVLMAVEGKHRRLYKDMTSKASIQRSYSSDVKVELENLPHSAVDIEQFRKYAERLDFAIDRDTIHRLFKALNRDHTVRLSADVIKDFYESWKYNEAACRDMEVVLGSKANGFFGDTVIKVSDLVRTDAGTGYLILTNRTLILLLPGAQVDCVKRIAKLTDIIKIHIVTVSVLATLGAVECVQLHYNLIGSTFKQCNLHLKEHSWHWKTLLEEMVSGKVISRETKDQFIMQQATQNTLLIDALINSNIISSSTTYSQVLADAVDDIMYFSKEDIKQRYLAAHDDNKDLLLYKLNPNSDELDNASVECVLYIAGGGSDHNSPNSRSSTSGPDLLPPTVWCGMSNGKVRVFNASTWRLYPKLIQCEDRVVCLASTGNHVWAGSFDTNIYVIKLDTQTLNFEMLEDHDDCVIDLQPDPENKDHIYSASINGHIYLWDTKTLQLLKQITVPSSAMTSFRVRSKNEIWCCCKDKENIVKVDKDGQLLTTLYYINEKNDRVKLDCFCIVGDHLWAGCSQSDRIVIWDIHTEERNAILPTGVRGVSKIIHCGRYVYIGCKCGEARSIHTKRSSLQQNTNLNGHQDTESYKQLQAKMFVADAEKFKIVKELLVHSDSVSCMFAVGDQYVLTGSASLDGRIVIWRQQSDYEEHGLGQRAEDRHYD